ncbi:multidrug resistance-associated protein 1-like [Watersipora subatra]|uniref:multidrug resistance-associated protein 1-like n=1 Tax=Watersipora subatra TaxID=2589382 RepID=UPI00355B5CCF
MDQKTLEDGFTAFCGSVFWNTTLTWNTTAEGNNTAPDFTTCFQQTVTSWVPCGFLWLTLPFYLYYLASADNSLRQNLTGFTATKSIIAVLLAGASLFDLGYTASVRYFDTDTSSYLYIPPVAYLTSALSAVTMLVAALLVQYYRVRGQFTSGILWIYWCLWALGSAVPLYSQIVHVTQVKEVEDTAQFTISIIYFTLVLVEVIMACISDASEDTRERFRDTCPEFLGSFSAYITYDWFTPTVVLGYKKSLEQSDLWKLGPRDISSGHLPAFEADWKAAVADWRHRNEVFKAAHPVAPLVVNETDDDTEAIIAPEPKKPKGPSLSLLKVVAKHYGHIVAVGWACKFVCDWLKFVDPQIQNKLITFVNTNDSPVPGVTPLPIWQGYVLAVGLLISQLVQTALFQQLWYLSLVGGFHVRAALISIIYKKALTMSPEAKKESTVGEIVNLMAVDAQRVQDVFSYVWIMWSAPLQIAIALWQLYETIGPSLFVGLGIMLVMMPLNGFVATKQRNLQIAQMKLKDSRIKMMNEVLSGIKVIKLYAWEPSFEEKVSAVRDKEMATIRKAWYYRAVQFFGFGALPFVVTVVTFAVYVSTNKDHILSPNVAFVSLSLFNILKGPLNLLPMMISFVVMSSVSVKRIVKFFKTSDLSEENVDRDDNCDVSLRVTNGTFSWMPETTKILHDINMEVPTGSLTSIVGQVGAGKSSLLSACVGDMFKHDGTVVSKGSVAFVAQQAWIQNATVRDNILFGKEYDEERYNRVVEAVALRPDFDILDNADLTLIGEKGINLSGGQKQRVSLARAVYNEADLYLLDDPLSAVDAHVGKHIFDHVIGPDGLLKDKTRVLVTHGVHWLPMVDNIVVLTDGRVSESGTYDALLSHDGAFAEFLKTFFLSGEEEEGEVDEDIVQAKRAILHRLGSVVEEGEDHLAEMVEERKLQRQLTKQLSRASESEPAAPEAPAVPEKKQAPTQAQDVIETVEVGHVSWDVYKLYARSMGYFFVFLTMGQMLLNAAVQVYSSIWLSMWTDDKKFIPKNPFNYSDDEIKNTMNMYLGVYGGLGGLQSFLTFGMCFAFAQCSVSASTVLHRQLLTKVMKAQMVFFDTKPLGQILNRFSKDMDTLDNVLGFTILSLFSNSMAVIGTVIVICYSTPIFLIVVIPIGILYYFIQRFFIPTTRQLKRLESVTRSPIYTQFSETITGAQTIRAYDDEKRFMQQSETMVEQNIVYFFAGWAANRWLAIRLEIMAAFIVFLTAIFCVISTEVSYLSDHLNSSLVGLAISYALASTQSLNFLIRNISDLESNIVSVERIKEYSEITLEAAWRNDHNAPPRDWPAKGAVEFKRYATRYRPELDLVLKEIDVSIRAQEKVGIVGRTGAGKSSMTLALFRLIEASSGSIHIDNVNIHAIGLHQLRNKITILPQDPVLFSGSVRDNLDPFSNYSDDRIWEVLEQSYLKEYVEKQPEKLGYECGEGGQNLSVGQRQLICLARSLLRKTKILVLDEATAAVDLETDDLIQKTIRTAFADCTILTIAHRLNTIMDSDRILVLDKGKVAEFDTPDNLLTQEDGIFYRMAKDAGIIKATPEASD